jgi:hypothetical protein
METAVTHTSMSELLAHLDDVHQSPRDGGRVDMIVVRPISGERRVLEVGELSEKGGLHGDRWADGCWKSLPDGSPDPSAQITIMNSRLAQLVANDLTRWPLAGDQLYADLDLSYENLPVGQRLVVGTAVLEITEELHKGCAKFRARFGDDALKFISNEEGRRLNLRGIYAKVVQAGVVKMGDEIRKI